MLARIARAAWSTWAAVGAGVTTRRDTGGAPVELRGAVGGRVGHCDRGAPQRVSKRWRSPWSERPTIGRGAKAGIAPHIVGSPRRSQGNADCPLVNRRLRRLHTVSTGPAWGTWGAWITVVTVDGPSRYGEPAGPRHRSGGNACGFADGLGCHPKLYQRRAWVVANRRRPSIAARVARMRCAAPHKRRCAAWICGLRRRPLVKVHRACLLAIRSRPTGAAWGAVLSNERSSGPLTCGNGVGGAGRGGSGRGHPPIGPASGRHGLRPSVVHAGRHAAGERVGYLGAGQAGRGGAAGALEQVDRGRV